MAKKKKDETETAAIENNQEVIIGEGTVTEVDVAEFSIEHEMIEETEEAVPAKKADKKGTTPESESDRFVYLGPSVTGTRLRENLVLRGKRESINAYFSDEIEQFPEVEQLLISIDRAAIVRDQIKKQGTNHYKNYEAVKKTAAKRGR